MGPDPDPGGWRMEKGGPAASQPREMGAHAHARLHTRTRVSPARAVKGTRPPAARRMMESGGKSTGRGEVRMREQLGVQGERGGGWGNAGVEGWGMEGWRGGWRDGREKMEGRMGR